MAVREPTSVSEILDVHIARYILSPSPSFFLSSLLTSRVPGHELQALRFPGVTQFRLSPSRIVPYLPGEPPPPTAHMYTYARSSVFSGYGLIPVSPSIFFQSIFPLITLCLARKISFFFCSFVAKIEFLRKILHRFLLFLKLWEIRIMRIKFDK